MYLGSFIFFGLEEKMVMIAYTVMKIISQRILFKRKIILFK